MNLYHSQQCILLWLTKACVSILSLSQQLPDTAMTFVTHMHVNIFLPSKETN